MSERIAIRNGRIIDPASGHDAVTDLFIADGKIASIGHQPDGFAEDISIDATQQIVCPGFVDLCARLREPGEEHKATIASEAMAAAQNGITTMICPPDTHPIIDTPAVVESIIARATSVGGAKVLPMGALTVDLEGAQLSEMSALHEAGCTIVSNAYKPVSSSRVLRNAMEYAATHDLCMFIHPDDHELTANGCMHEGAVSTRLGLPGIPVTSETAAVAFHLALIEQTGVRAHFTHISTARAVRMIARAQHDGVRVSANVTAHHLHLTDQDIGNYNSHCHVIPPLRTETDRQGLREGILDQTITAICSDHQPHEPDAKLHPFPATAPGISGVDTLLPLSLQFAREQGLSLPDIIATLTSGPARIAGIHAGTLQQGKNADICVFHPETIWTLTPDNMKSLRSNNPFIDQKMTGKVTHTLINGRLVYKPL